MNDLSVRSPCKNSTRRPSLSISFLFSSQTSSYVTINKSAPAFARDDRISLPYPCVTTLNNHRFFLIMKSNPVGSPANNSPYSFSLCMLSLRISYTEITFLLWKCLSLLYIIKNMKSRGRLLKSERSSC